MKIYLVRHGESESNAAMMLYGRTDSALTENGRAQARAIAEKLRGQCFERCVASTLIRADETAKIIVGEFGVPVEHDERLVEQDMGEWENTHFPTIMEREPVIIGNMLRDWTKVVPPGGESFDKIRARVAAAIDDIIAAGKDTLIVAHAGPLATATAVLLELPDSAVRHFWYEQGCWSCVDNSQGVFKLKYFNK